MPIADEFGALEARDHAQHTGLFAPFELRLESDEAEVVGRKVVLPQLHRGIRGAAGLADP